MHGNQDSSRVDLEYTDHFMLLRGLQGPSRLVTVFLGTLWSSIKEVKALFVFDAEHGIAEYNAGETDLIFPGGVSLMVFCELRWEPGEYSRVTEGMALQNSCLFSDVRTPV